MEGRSQRDLRGDEAPAPLGAASAHKQDAELVERFIDLRAATRGRDAVRDSCLPQLAQELDRAGQRPALDQDLAEDLAVTALDRLRFVVAERPADLPRHRAREQTAAHTDATVDLPAVDGHAGLAKRALPGEDVRVHGVDERPVQIEDERAHAAVMLETAR